MKISKDVNGNKTLKIEACDTLNHSRGFSIQTLDNLPLTHSEGVNDKTLLEVKLYILKHGTTSQKSKFDTLITRKEYMADSSNLFSTYYLQFANSQSYDFIKNRIGIDKLLTSKCEHLNDLYKHSNNGAGSWIWDYTPVNLPLARLAGEVSATGTGSQAFHTCVGKCVAKKLVAEHKAG